MERGKHKIELVRHLGEVKHKGRTYKIVRERIADTGDEYVSIKLYNAQGKFIKRFMIDPDIAGDIGLLLLKIAEVLPYEELRRRFPHLFRD